MSDIRKEWKDVKNGMATEKDEAKLKLAAVSAEKIAKQYWSTVISLQSKLPMDVYKEATILKGMAMRLEEVKNKGLAAVKMI